MTLRLKKQSKIIGWDDGPFEKNQLDPAPLVGVVTRGGGQVDGVIKTEIKVDGMDSTKQMITRINSSKHKQELSLIMTDGITFAGFNVLDIHQVSQRTGLPVLAVTRKKVNYEEIKRALTNLPEFHERWGLIQKAGEINSIPVQGKKLNYQTTKLSQETVEKAVSISSTSSVIPEPLRLAHMIASALVTGES